MGMSKQEFLSAHYQKEKRKWDGRVRLPDELLDILLPEWNKEFPLKMGKR